MENFAICSAFNNWKVIFRLDEVLTCDNDPSYCFELFDLLHLIFMIREGLVIWFNSLKIIKVFIRPV